MTALPILETKRLRLRPFTPADGPIVHALAGDERVAATTLHIPHPYPEGAAEAWIATHAGAAENGAGYTWAIVRSSDDQVMGAIGIHVSPAAPHSAEIGYWLGVPFWGQGYTTEAARRVVAFGFAQLELRRIQATCFPRNVASARVMEKAGLRYEGLLRAYVRKGDVYEDLAMYASLTTDIESSAP